jgi:predicted amidohydrolase
MTTFTAAVVQMRSSIDVEENLVAMEQGVRDAARAGAQYVQTPEMTGLVEAGRKDFFAKVKTQEEEPLVRHAGALASELGIYLHIGSTPILVDEGRAANRALLFNPKGELIATYDKIHMFDVDLDNGESWRESAVYRAGDMAVVAEVDKAKVGMSICYDVRFAMMALDYASAGAQILTYPSCFTRQTGQAHWHTLLRSRAIETGSFVIAAAQGGKHEDGRETYGHSLIINPWGEVIGEVEGDEPGFALAEIDTDLVGVTRAKIPNLKNAAPYRVVTS